LILSHRHRFIFVKTNKTAGTSVEIALSRHCGPADVITPVSPEDEALRRELGCPGPQNCLPAPRWRSLPEWARTWLRTRRPPHFYNHISAREIRALVPPAVWHGYFKFCVERNPWDRVVSSYYWKTRDGRDRSIEQFLAQGRHLGLKRKGSGLYTIDGRVAVDRVCRFERLAEDLETIRSRLGIPEPLELPRAKSSHRPESRHYRDLLSADERDLVARDFAFEIETFGYVY